MLMYTYTYMYIYIYMCGNTASNGYWATQNYRKGNSFTATALETNPKKKEEEKNF